MSPQNPTLVLVPGSFLPASHYDPIVSPLTSLGYKTHILSPPCYHTKKQTLPDMLDDAAHISSFLTTLADAGEEIVLVAHSYGGMPASQCLEGLSVGARRAEGKSGGVRRLAFVTAVVPTVGNGVAETMVGGMQVPLEPDADGWLFHPDPGATKSVCLNLTPEPAATKAMDDIGQHSSAAFASTLTYAGYADVPVSWFFCEEDRCIVPDVQQTAVKDIEESWKGTEREGQKVEVTRVKCDHFPTTSAPKELGRWFEGLLSSA